MREAFHVSMNPGTHDDTHPFFDDEAPKPLTDQQKRAILAGARRLIAENPRRRLHYRYPNFLRGKDIKEVQRALDLPETGKYGVGTYNAVCDLQEILGLEQTGDVNQELWVWIVYFALVKAYED
jgi:peptidoglycan hydrolase-like protein with peptidoglycan-binding domain